MKLAHYLLALVFVISGLFILGSILDIDMGLDKADNQESQKKQIQFHDEVTEYIKIDSLSFNAVTGRMNDVAGITGIKANNEENPPKLNSSEWELFTKVEDTRRVAPGGFYRTKNGLGLLYVTRGRFGGETYAAVGGLMATANLKDWKWYENNPVLDTYVGWNNATEWGRIMPYGLAFDSDKERFIAYYNARGSYGRIWDGQRAVGIAYSEDMIHWTYDERSPLYTISDFQRDASDLIVDTENFQDLGRVYLHGAWKYDNKYYLLISGSISTDSDGSSSYQRIILSSNYPDKDFERFEFDRSGAIPYSVPVKYGETWYLPWRKDGMVGIYTSSSLAGPFKNFTPLFNKVPDGVEPGRSLQFRLFRWQDKWAIAYYVDVDDNRVMYIGRENK